MVMRKICVVTGSRAEYGLLSSLMAAIKADPDMQLQVIATNMHLSPEFGLTYQEIEADGFRIDKKVQMLLSSDTANATTKSVGLATIGFADAYEDLKPDIIVVLGDRYEILAAVTAALFYKIPVAHLHGGEITEGAYDDSIRHAITKMSHLHFTSTEEYRNRVIQLGEQPERVFNVGAIGVKNIRNEELMSLEELQENLNFELGDKCFLVTFHPVTMENNTSYSQCKILLEALEEFIDEYKILITLPNSDTDGRIITSLIRDFEKKHSERVLTISSLGKKRYYSALKYVTSVVGNSSSGLIEVPSFHIPTLNVGNRQKGRVKGDSVVDCPVEYNELVKALKYVLSPEMKAIAKKADNPYYKANTLHHVFSILSEYDFNHLVNKQFYNIV